MQVTIQLDNRARRPIANLEWFKGCRALIDTGSLFPIWNGIGEDLEHSFNAKLQKRDVAFRGFGGEAKGDLYRVNFEMNGLYYVDMPIIASELEGANWNMIVSATMLDGTTYEIDTVNKRLNIDTKDNQPVRILRLSDDDDKLSIYFAGAYTTVAGYEQKNAKCSIQDIEAN